MVAHTGADPTLLLAEVVVTLAFFGLVAYVAREYRGHPGKAAVVLASVATSVAVLPSVLYALFY